MKHQFINERIPVQAIPSQAIAAAGTYNGPAIVDPAKYGRELTFLLDISGTGITVLTIRVEGSNDLGVTWTPLKQNDGVTDLAFPAASTIAAAVLAGTSILQGSIPCDRAGYKWFRLAVRTVTGGTVNISALAIIGGQLYSAPPAAPVDQLLQAFLPTGST
jgi:hypothetical protein